MYQQFNFKGDWDTTINLKEFSKFDANRFFEYHKEEQKKLTSGFVNLIISDDINENPDPNDYQINTIDFIIQNQSLLINHLFQRIIDVEYPFMKEHIDDTKYWFPDIKEIEDLKKVLGIISIQVLPYFKDNFAYYLINFYASYEDEHGVHFLFHKGRIIDSGNAWEYDLKKICKDGNLNEEKIIDDYNSKDEKIFYLIKPHKKYNRLKPWQFDANEGLPYRLVRNQKNLDLINLIDNKVLTLIMMRILILF